LCLIGDQGLGVGKREMGNAIGNGIAIGNGN
jgi:hypothetical protein